MARTHGFLMIKYDKPEMIQELQNMIPYEELYEEEDNDDYGIEDMCHVTLVPCLDKHMNVEELKKELMELGKYSVLISNISKFENDDYDVLKCDVGSQNLLKTNDKIRSKFPTFSEYKDYHPHMTIAYMKKGMADKYLQDSIMPLLVLKPKCFIWSGSNEDESDVNIEWI